MSNEEYRPSGGLAPSPEHATTARSTGQGTQQVSRLMNEQKHRAADGLHRLAGVLRGRTRNLGPSGVRGQIATSADRAAARMDSMSVYVHESDFPTMFRDARQLARRRPELFVAGGFLAGLLVGRYVTVSRRGAAGPWTSAARWQEALEKGTQVLSAAAGTLQHGAEARGFSPERLVDKVAGSRLAKQVALAGERYWGKS